MRLSLFGQWPRNIQRVSHTDADCTLRLIPGSEDEDGGAAEEPRGGDSKGGGQGEGEEGSGVEDEEAEWEAVAVGARQEETGGVVIENKEQLSWFIDWLKLYW